MGDWSKGESREFAFDPNSTENEGRWRLYSPGKIEPKSYFRRKSSTPGVSYVMGKSKDTGETVIQAVRFDKGKFTEAEAGKWWAKNKGRDKLKFASTGVGMDRLAKIAERVAAGVRHIEKSFWEFPNRHTVEIWWEGVMDAGPDDDFDSVFDDQKREFKREIRIDMNKVKAVLNDIYMGVYGELDWFETFQPDDLDDPTVKLSYRLEIDTRQIVDLNVELLKGDLKRLGFVGPMR